MNLGNFKIKPAYYYWILGLYLIYSLLFIYRTSFVVSDTRYFSLFDDEMISMRYAKNFAHGNGLVGKVFVASNNGFAPEMKSMC